MKMTQYNHFICHFYCHFSEFSHILLSAGHDVPEEVWRPLLIFFSKIISCCLQAGWPFPWRVHFWEPFSRIHPWPPFPCVQRMWIFHILYRTFGWHYWHIWNRQPRILPSLTSARISSSVLPTPTTLSSLNTPWLLSATTTLVEPERFFFLRTNMPQR